MGALHRSTADLSLEVSLILLCVGAVGPCTVSVVQLRHLEVDPTHPAVTIECNFSTTGCPEQPPLTLWFRYGAHQAESLCLGAVCSGATDKFTVREALDQKRVSLTVNRVTLNDSAVYICGIAFPSAREPRAKQTGAGTTLVVRESDPLSRELQGVLIALLVLLSIYITGVGVTFGLLSRSKSNALRNKETKEDSQKKRSARRIFQEIAQELYQKRYVETRQQSEKDSTYENRRALSNYERP